MPIDGAKIRSTLLRVISDYQDQHPGAFYQALAVLAPAAGILGEGRHLTQMESQALLVAFYDLFRTGHLSWGSDLANPSPPFFHIAEQGRTALRHLSRDPSNPDGYLSYLRSRATLGPVAQAYVDEAIQTFNTNCFRAAAVMIGAAAESLVLQLRDTVVAGINKTGREPAKDLSHQLIKKVIEAVRKELEMQQSGMCHELREDFGAYWPGLVQQIRTTRNDAGHPTNIDRLTPETVHGALLIFPDLAGLSVRLAEWASTHYKAAAAT